MFGRFVRAFVSAAALAAGVMADEPVKETAGETSGAMRDALSNNPDQAFAAVLVSHARLQREISELVAEKATNPQIKQLAKDQADVYNKFGERIRNAAQKDGITLHQDRMLPRDQAILNHLRGLPADRLERDYVFYQAGENETLRLLSEWASNNAKKPEVKQAAKEITDKLQQRGQTIQKLAQEEVGSGK